MSINEIKDLVFKNYYERIGFPKEKNYYSMKRLKKKRFIVARKQINRKKTLILAMLKNTIDHL